MKSKNIILSLFVVVGLFFVVAQGAPEGCDGPVCGDGVCEAGESCPADCEPSCTDECSTEGQIGCSAIAYRYLECGNFDQDECLEWSLQQNCPYGEVCTGYPNGSCGAPPANCTETDGGVDKENFGVVSGFLNNSQGTFWAVRDDECRGDNVNETACAGGTYIHDRIEVCPYGCADGACLNATSPPGNETNETGGNETNSSLVVTVEVE